MTTLGFVSDEVAVVDFFTFMLVNIFSSGSTLVNIFSSGSTFSHAHEVGNNGINANFVFPYVCSFVSLFGS